MGSHAARERSGPALPGRQSVQPASDRKESGTFAIGTESASTVGAPPSALPRIDLSRADARHRPTVKLTRKLDRFLPPDPTLRSDYAPPSHEPSLDRRALVVLVALTGVAAALAAALVWRAATRGAASNGPRRPTTESTEIRP
jgi:hypothetical protein